MVVVVITDLLFAVALPQFLIARSLVTPSQRWVKLLASLNNVLCSMQRQISWAPRLGSLLGARLFVAPTRLEVAI